MVVGLSLHEKRRFASLVTKDYLNFFFLKQTREADSNTLKYRYYFGLVKIMYATVEPCN